MPNTPLTPDAPTASASLAPTAFALDLEDLRNIASDGVIQRGVRYFREDRVMKLDWDADELRASVEGSRKEGPYGVTVGLDEEEALYVDCDCPFDGEPVCKHAVAALVAAASQRPATEQELRGAEERAIEERRDSARAEVRVKHVGGDRWFGSWEARSTGLHGDVARAWPVAIRSLGGEGNHCACPDFATNLLGTCKHIEAVLHRLKKRAPRKFDRLESEGPSVPVVAIDWSHEGGPRVVLLGSWHAGSELRRLLDAHFGEDDSFRGRIPEGIFALQRSLAARDDVLLGPEVLDFARRRSEDIAQQARAREIRDELRRAGDRLPGLRAKLYPYQVDGVAFLAASGRALLADDMGLGKTLQAIAAGRWLMANEGARRALIVCPTSLKSQWAKEIERFTGDEVMVIQGSPARRLPQWRGRSPWTVVNYELLLRDGSVIARELAPDLLILDEAQRIKNWRTRSAAAVKRLQTRYAFVLTGTPMENRLEDLYSLMQVIEPRILGPLWRFLAQYHVQDPRGQVLGFRNLSELRERLAPVLLRRDRRLVRDQLPDRIETQLDVPLSPRQQELHDEAVTAAGRLGQILKRRPLTPQEQHRLMAALQTARMACDAAGLVDKETRGSPKLSELGRLLEELCIEGGRKVVVFSEWERMTAMGADVARSLGLGFVRLHGDVPSGKRGALIDRFNDDPSVQVFFSTDAGGVGLNLQAASALINLDLPWNPAVLNQRIARIHRLGQTEPVQIVKLVAAESYELRVAALLAGKQRLFDNVVVPDASLDSVELPSGMVKKLLAALGAEEPTELAASKATAPEEPPTTPPQDAPARPSEQGRASLPALRSRLGAASALVEAGFSSEAMDLALEAMIGALASRLGRVPPERENAGLWLYGELLPQGCVDLEQASAISRCLALGRAKATPKDLCAAVITDAEQMLRQIEPS